jgi:hypothetical protein
MTNDHHFLSMITNKVDFRRAEVDFRRAEVDIIGACW